MTGARSTQQGGIVWLILILLAGIGFTTSVSLVPETEHQRQMRHTIAVLSLAHQALLAYAQQSLVAESCGLNCPRPGDLPCPDRNHDGVAESSCSQSARLGRLPWKTLGIGDVRDGSGEHLWYAVSDRYKNNPRKLPLNLDTPGSWSVMTTDGLSWDAPQGQGVVAIVIAPMHSLVREDGWIQRRSLAGNEVAQHYLEKRGIYDNATPQEDTSFGFVSGPASSTFNDVLWPITASQMHQIMQKQVIAEVKQSLRCLMPACHAFPAPAAIQDGGCLGHASLANGLCQSSTHTVGRFPVDGAAHWPWAAQHLLDGHAQHHWLQQNGWREYIFYQPGYLQANIVISGERLSGQSRAHMSDKAQLKAYLESATLASLHIADPEALALPSNDSVDRVGQP